MKIEVGKSYRSRSGVIYKVTGYNGYTYMRNGLPMWYEGGYALKSGTPNPEDLIEEIKEGCNMEFLTKSGTQCLGESGPLKVGDRVIFADGSYSCYATREGFTSDSPAAMGRQEKGVIIAVGCKLPALCSYDQLSIHEHNDTIVFTDSGKAYFTRLSFLKRV